MRSDRFALFGGRPAFADPLHVGAPNLCDRSRFYERLDRVFDSGRLTNRGPMVREFETAIAERSGVDHCVAMCNATTALEIGARALGLSGEVLVPAFTFVATAHALTWQGIQPVFCDIDPETHLIDPVDAERRITSRTTGILAVHLWGRPAPVEALRDLAERNGLRLMYDAAHAFGCSHKGRPLASYGDLAVYSFHATKALGTAEGGAVVTDDPVLASSVRDMQNFGFRKTDHVAALGINGKMSELSAAMGLTALEQFDGWTAVNAMHHLAYREGLAGVPGVIIREERTDDDRNHQYVIVDVDRERAGLSRDTLVDLLQAENVLARRYFHPGCHRMEPYASRPWAAREELPVTESVCGKVMVLPTGTAVTVADIAVVCDLIRDAVAASDEIGERVRPQTGKVAP